ncbi:MAG: ribbon-helix-helix domain-containing protein [Hyphomicrobiaceae bacterium]
MSRGASKARKEAPPTDAARRKAALKARSGIERSKPEPTPEPAPFPTGKGRKSLKGISIYMNPLAKEVLDKIAKEQQRTVQDLGLEALNLLFRKYGEKPIA